MVDDTLKPCSWNESGYTRILITEFGWLCYSFSFCSLLYIIVCNELAFYFPSYLFPVMLSYASFSSYDTRVALDHFASSLCCRICLSVYSSCSPTRLCVRTINTHLSISTKLGSLRTPLHLEDGRCVPVVVDVLMLFSVDWFSNPASSGGDSPSPARRCGSQIFVQENESGQISQRLQPQPPYLHHLLPHG